MKGILLKDFYNLNGQLKMYLLFPVLGIFMAYMQHSATILIFLLGILIVTIPMSAFAYDDLADFSTYALTMPITRKDLIVSKYILSLLITIVCGLLALASVYLLYQLLGIDYFEGASIRDAFLFTIIYMLVMNAVNCILLPLNFKYGTEKGRIFFFLIFFGIGGIGYLINYVSTLFDPSLLNTLYCFLSQYGSYIVVLVLLVLEAISLMLSLRILEKKEF